MKLSTSILSIAKDLHKIKGIDLLETEYIHLDVMDGKFVPNTCEFEQLTFLQKPLDIHLMVEDVDAYIEKYAPLHPVYITFHVEATSNVNKTIDKIHKKGCLAGISVKPSTPVSAIAQYLDKVDLVLVMSVEPGKGGQAFLDHSVTKIKELSTLRTQSNYTYVIEVDGGIDEHTSILCKEADILVVGSFIVLSDVPSEQVKKIKQNF